VVAGGLKAFRFRRQITLLSPSLLTLSAPAGQSFALRSGLTNLSQSDDSLSFRPPWGYTYSISLAAVTTDGEQVPNLYPIADKRVEIRRITLKPGQSCEGDYDIENVVQLSQAPKGKDILVLWSYEVPGDFKRPKPVCTGVVIIPKGITPQRIAQLGR